MGEPVLRRATIDDIGAVTALVAESFEKYVERIGKPPAPMLTDYAEMLDTSRIWVVAQGAAVIAVLVTQDQGDHLLLDTVAVSPSAQGGGYGRRLLELAERDATEQGLRELRLVTNEAMTENLVFYPRHGYRETHRAVQDGYRRVFFSKTVAE
ncbi:N-acetyltransferase [Mycolicibacterium sp. P9-64]|uniref:GNAT family N-acetyltransferase n=1 Tax=Mycolicibacterium sp. P9-64 TaxID=2024612 RepID=UPI0011ED9133|nr:GNAT family N-acetyltransferase [Mycolicibacterium sp. P9-64]KAA0085543.1 N-acetyltransferase [Mycolicibacterium sp. P9-64]